MPCFSISLTNALLVLHVLGEWTEVADVAVIIISIVTREKVIWLLPLLLVQEEGRYQQFPCPIPLI